ncbi:MAG: cyclic nucleotide-binding domain-containing protein [Pseudomonadota bacterium]
MNGANTMDPMRKMLSEHVFFKNFDRTLILELVECASVATFGPDTMIYREDEPADSFLLIRKGRVAVEIFVEGRGPLTIQTVYPGDVLGWSWLFPPYRRRFDARAVEATETIVLDGLMLREKAENNNRLGYELLKRFSKVVVDRLQAASVKLLDIYGHHA